MPVLRTLRTWTSFVLLGLVALGPIAALCAAAILDQGPSGGPRTSIFSVAITALDPLVWTCLRNSLIVAGAATAGSMIVGVLIGRLIGDWRYPARPLLLAAMTASAVAPPAIVALGISLLFEGGLGDRIIGLERLGAAGRFIPADGRWYAWFWAALVQGGALAALACHVAQGRLDPAWRDAARLAGGTRGRVWRKLNWPLLRPAIARAGGLVFVLTIADPGAPMILGLRRTLGYQIVTTALRDDPFPRIAVLGLTAAFACFVVRRILSGWAGPEPSFRSGAATQDRPLRAGSLRRSAAGAAMTALWGVAAGVPLAAVLLESGRSTSGLGFSLEVLAGRLVEPTTIEVGIDSLWLGAGVGVLFAISGRMVRALPMNGASIRLLAFLHSGVIPPLVLGVASLCLPRLIGLTADVAGGSSLQGFSEIPNRASMALASVPISYLIPALGVWLAMTPSLLAVWEGGFGVDHDREDRIAAAVLAGATWTRAQGLASPWSRTDAFRRMILTTSLAATNIAPALLLANGRGARTLGPGILLFREDPGLSTSSACALAVAALTINVVVVFTCSPAGLAARVKPVERPKSG